MTGKECGCCEGTEILTPMNRANRPGLDQLRYRAGIHATFLETMKARLSNLCLGSKEDCQAGRGSYPLQKLTTRADSDPAIAFLDAWAAVADVLTFYQERIANEGYLLTATERRSILELARLIGYRLRPGVAASTFLAFTLEKGHQVEIPAGTRAQSIPGPGELPQPFETSEPLQARDLWNGIEPRLTEPQFMSKSTSIVHLRGLQHILKPNDPVLVVSVTSDGEPEARFRRVHEIEQVPEDDRTDVLLRGELNVLHLESFLNQEPSISVRQVGAPTQPDPSDGEQDVSTDLTLKWDGPKSEEVSGPVVYSLAWGTNETDLSNVVSNLDKPEYALPPLDIGTVYYWRVTAQDDLSTTSGKVWRFTTVWADAPAPDDDGVPTDVVLQWVPVQVEGAETITYSVYFGEQPELPEEPYAGEVPSNKYKLTDLKLGIDYYWRVTANDGHKTEVVMSQKFTTTNSIPMFDASAVSTTATLRWKESDPPGATYNVEVSTEYLPGVGIGERSFINEEPLHEPLFTIPLEKELDLGTRYYWRVTTIPPEGEEQVGQVWQFTTESVDLSGYSPADHSHNESIPVTLSWPSSGPGATFTVELSTERLPEEEIDDASVVDNEDPSATSYTTTADDEVKPGTRYYWRITPSDGKLGPIFRFTTDGFTEEDQNRKNMGNCLVRKMREQFTEKDPDDGGPALLRLLGDAELSAELLRKYIGIKMPALERAESISGRLSGRLEEPKKLTYPDTNLDFDELDQWITDVQNALKHIDDELDVRRLVLNIPERIFAGQTVSRDTIDELIDHRGEIPDTVQGTDVDLISQSELAALETDLDEAINFLLASDSEDDKIAKIKEIKHRVEALTCVFESLQSGETVVAWNDGLLGLLKKALVDTEPPSDETKRVEAVPSLIEHLQTRPSLQPENALRLSRRIEDIFSTDADPTTRSFSDLTTRLLTTFQPRLQDTFYQAWAQTSFSPPLTLQGLEALRVKAAPFAAKAGPKLIYDNEGKIIGQKEWPLLGISLRLLFDSFFISHYEGNPDHYHLPVWVEISLTWEGELREEARVRLDYANLTVSLTVRGLELRISAIPSSRHGYRAITIDILGELLIRLEANDSETQTLVIGDYRGDFSTLKDVVRVDTVNGSLATIHSEFGDITERGYGVEVAKPVFFIEDVPLSVPAALRKVLTLDAEYDQIIAGDWVVIEWAGLTRPVNEDLLYARVENVQTISKANYGKVTQLTLDTEWLKADDFSLFVLRNATIYTQSEALPLAEQPITMIVKGRTITLNGLFDRLEAGRWVIVSGERADVPGTRGVRTSEAVMIANVRHVIQQDDESGNLIPGDTPHTQIELAGAGLVYEYYRESVTIYGNVVKATHGETRQEVLGSGDGNQARQAFTLKQSPLTHLAAPTETGIQSTLQIRVNDILWQEVDNLIWLQPSERGYVTRTDNEDRTTVMFGDGQQGARLPTGIENIKAVYRTGIGQAGNVAAEQISLLATKPLGVKEVINPLAASGGADRERRDQARRNAPLAVMSLDRLVSIQDYEDFARTFAGIEKARAVRLTNGRQELVHITIAGIDDIPIEKASDLYQSLSQALHRFGAPNQPIQIEVRELMLLVVSARIRILSRYQWEVVASETRDALLDTFSFERRQLGQDLLRSKVLSTIQSVPGVAYVDLEVLDGIPENIPGRELETFSNHLKRAERITVKTSWIQTHHAVERGNETLATIAERYHDVTEAQLLRWNKEILDALAEELKKELKEALEKEPDETVKKELEEKLEGINFHQDPLPLSTPPLFIPRRIRPAQLAYLSPDIPDTLILTEIS